MTLSFGEQLVLVILPAIVGALGTVVSIVVARRLEVVRRQTNGALELVARRADDAHELAQAVDRRHRPADSTAERD